MKQKAFIIGIVFFFVSMFNHCTRQSDFPVLKGPYLGQKPPGKKPEIFAPGVISTEENGESCSGFGMDGKLLVFLRFQSGDLNIVHVSENKYGSWTKPYPAPFNSRYSDWDCNFAPDGRTFYFSSNRPVKEGIEAEKPWNIWVTRFMDGTWASPGLLEYPVNSEEHNDGYASVTEDGTLYFFSVGREDSYGQDDLYRAVLTDGEYTKVENLGGNINSEFGDADPFIAPDESYLIFGSNRPGGFGELDLYVSFRKRDGSWMESINLGSGINSKSRDFIPTVTPDGRFFFFTSERRGKGDIYWVSTEVIHALKPKAENDEFPVLEGPYLGQKPPGMTPELFAPGLLSVGGAEANITFTPDGMECCYTLWTPGLYSESPFAQKFIFYSRMENGRWTEPKELPFNPGRQEMYPFFSPDGKRLYFGSWRSGSPRTMFVEKSNGEWCNPKEISVQFNSLISVASNGNIYLVAQDNEIEGPYNYFIYKSCYKNGEYLYPEKLSNAINDEGCFRPYIAPDESYIIFDREESENNIGNHDEEDLYISFRDKNGEWLKAKNMGNGVNSKYRDKRAFVSFDGKYLFFASSRIETKEFPKDSMILEELRQLMHVPTDGCEHIYWVDTSLIEELRKTELKHNK